MFLKLKTGINLYYETFGNTRGRPLVFLHGNEESSLIFKDYISHFKDYYIVLVDSRCHGKSSSGRLSYDLMKEDMIELIESLNLSKPSLIGFSDGAIVSILISLEYSNIDKLFLIGPNINPNGLKEEAIKYFKENESIYSNLCLNEPKLEPSSLNKIVNRTIIISGENDLIKDDHLELISNSIPNSYHYTISGASHFIPMENKDELIEILDNELKIDVYYEDSKVIVVDKKAGLLSQEDDSKELDLLNLVKDYLKIKYHKKGNVYLGLVQRLDRNVSGLMLFAKNSKSYAFYNKFRPKKTYLALCYGKFEKEKDTIKNMISKDEKKKIAYESKDGKEAILSYEVLSYKDNISLVKVNIETGRFHQIRFQLSNIGHPILNDSKYSSFIKKEGYDLGLDAYKIVFSHYNNNESENCVIKRLPNGLFVNFLDGLVIS